MTPGPLTIFRKKVFDDLGPYSPGHNTEDLEIAYRMQKNYYKIEQCNDAIIYTNTPSTIKTLYKQRLRWVYGFLSNTIDYKKIMFRKKYGNFSIFTVPINLFSIFSICFIFFRIIFNFGSFLYNKIIEFFAIGVDMTANIKSPDLYFINTNISFIMSFIIILLLIVSITIGKKILENRWRLSFGIVYLMLTHGLIGPFWILNGVYNTILSRNPAWR